MVQPRTGKRLLFALLILSVCFFVRADAQNADSLRGILVERKQEDTTKVRLYIAAGNAYKYSSPDSMLALAGRGIALSEKIGYEKGKAGCLVVKTLASLIAGNLDAGMEFATQAVDIYKRIGDTVAIGNAYYFIAAIYYNQSKYEKAIAYYSLTVQAERHTDHYDRLGDALDNIGVCYSSMGDFSNSLKFYLESLKVHEKAGDQQGCATVIGNIARAYASLGNHKKAVEYINKSLAIPGIDAGSAMIVYENAGNVYLSISDTIKALAAFERAIQIADSSGQMAEINRIMVNAGEVYIIMGNFDKAHEMYKRCHANSKIPNSPAVEAIIHWGMGRVYTHNKNYRAAINELDVAIALFREYEMKDQLTEGLKNLAVAYASVNDYANAYRAMAQYDTAREAILNDETQRKAKELQYEYDLQNKQTEIELLAKDKTIAKGKSETQNAILLGLLSGLGLLLVIVVLMFRSRQRAKDANELILKQAGSLRELNNYKDRIFSVLAHDLRGPISALATSVTMLDEKVITPKEFSELKPLVDQQLKSVTLLLENLLKWSMNHIVGSGNIKKEQLDLHMLVAQNISLMQRTAEEKNITVTNNVTPGTRAVGDTSNVDIIIRNLISNAVKFTRTGGSIVILARVNGSNIELSVTDNGVGMGEDQLKKLFTASPDNSSFGTAGERGIGLGLLMSYEFARANNGDILVSSELGKGSTFTLVLPA